MPAPKTLKDRGPTRTEAAERPAFAKNPFAGYVQEQRDEEWRAARVSDMRAERERAVRCFLPPSPRRSPSSFTDRTDLRMKDSARTLRAGLIGVLAGGTLGLATGLLVAPQKGQKVRRRLIYQFENAALRAGLYVEDFLRSSPDGSDARRTGDALVEDAETRAELIREDIDALLEDLQ